MSSVESGSAMSRRRMNLSVWQTAILIGLAALMLRLMIIAVAGRNIHLEGDSFSYDEMARLMMSGWGWFATPLFVREPLYPAFMALAYALPGGGIGTVQVLQALTGAIACVFAYLTLRLAVRESIAVLGAMLIASNLDLLGFTVLPLREILVTALLTAFLMTFILAMLKPGKGRLFICSLCFVLLAHTDVRFLPLVVMFPLMTFAFHRTFAVTIRQTLWFGLFFVLLMVPYQTRGYVAIGKPVIITERFLGKWLDRASKQVSGGEEKSGDKRKQWLAEWEAKKRAELDAITEEERAFFMAGGRPETNPLSVHWFLFREYWRFARFVPEYRPYPDGRFADPWSLRHNVSSTLSVLPFLVLLPFVFVRAPRASLNIAWPLIIFLGAHAAMHVFVHARARYRIPMEVITSILLAMALVNLWELLRRRRERRAE